MLCLVDHKSLAFKLTAISEVNAGSWFLGGHNVRKFSISRCNENSSAWFF